MPERQPLTMHMRVEAFLVVLDVLTPEQFVCFLRLAHWIAVNVARLPWDFDECCHIANAKTNAQRATLAQVTGLTPLSRVTESVTGYRDVARYGNAIQGLCFEGSPELGLTLRADRDWGIDPLGAAEHKEKVRQQIRDRVRKHRAKAGNALHTPDGNGLLVCARNSENTNTNTEERVLLLPSVVVAHAARAREEGPGLPEGTAEGRRRGEALKAMRACGLTGINGLHPEFLALLATGITDDELRWGAEDAVAKGKGFPYAVAALLRSRQDAVAGTPAPIPSERPLSAWEARARELAGPSAIGYKPPT
jgi:hypothetical protein